MRSRRALLCALSITGMLLAGATETATAPTVNALLGTQRVHMPLEALADRAPLAPDQDFRVVELGRDAGTSHHVVAIRKAEKPHRHDRHDLLVLVVRGYGSMRIGDATLPVSEGSLIYVPRGAVHAFTNASAWPAVSYAIYSPPFDGTDRVEAQ
jgi:mannose-6-phosphate isomerase-like protein (cupin superfamily)